MKLLDQATGDRLHELRSRLDAKINQLAKSTWMVVLAAMV